MATAWQRKGAGMATGIIVIIIIYLLYNYIYYKTTATTAHNARPLSQKRDPRVWGLLLLLLPQPLLLRHDLF